MRFVSHPQLVLLAAIALFPFLGLAGERPNDAQYIYGSVKTIPVSTPGALDLTDSIDLRFHYGKVDFQLPYKQIKDFQFTESKPASQMMAHLPFPKLSLRRREKMLDISFRDDHGDLGSVSFRLTGSHAASTEWLLSQRMDALKREAQADGRALLPESWWGDSYWKTARNQAIWADPANPAAGTK